MTPLYEEVRTAAVSRDLPDAPFLEVPCLLKDLRAMQKGQPYYGTPVRLPAGVQLVAEIGREDPLIWVAPQQLEQARRLDRSATPVHASSHASRASLHMQNDQRGARHVPI